VEIGAGAVRERLLAHLQRLDAAFHNRWPAGQLLSRPEIEVNWVGLFTDVVGHTSDYIAAVIAVSVFLFAAIGPDMIVDTDFDEEVYDRLSEIAPTVLVERGSNGDWRRRFLEVAEAVGRTERAEEVEADYERMISELPEVVRDTTVAFIRPDNGQFRIDSTAEAFPGSVAEDAGIPILDAPEGVGEFAEEFGYVTVSGELLDVVTEAGLIVMPDFSALPVEDSDSVSQFERNPLWERLPAVRKGKVLQVPGLVCNGSNHYAAELLLREIEQALA
jgi:ABC-type Fe3+-hydroxamate transport system substrate-binding protein